ncbi:MAG: M48 family metallopeptidase [Lewinellaceae bacterium]|nr:M48 family metallopeptidase [Saprospiraceae bacterium]MCB9329867.1 M48 family metallopeptidase [Lewinellaceae bacterium]
MTQHFAATLHNTETQTKNQVVIYLKPGLLVVQNDQETIEWLPADIQSARLLNDGSAILQNGAWFLDVSDRTFSAALEQHFDNQKLFRRTFFDRVGLMGCLLALLAVAIPVLVVWFWVVPFVAERAAKKITPEVEQKIGDSWYQSLTTDLRIDSNRTRQVQQFYDALQFGGAYPIKVTVVQEPMVNAFAVPGGHIVVFDSILGIMDAPEQLAGLLAHEASHIQLKHSTRAVFRELSNQLFFSIVFGDYGSFSSIVAQHGGQLAGLSYSRSLELEADAHGLDLLEKSHIPPDGMPALFRKILVAGPAAMDAPNFLSTHPAMEERIRAAEKQIAGMPDAAAAVSPDLEAIWQQIKR